MSTFDEEELHQKLIELCKAQDCTTHFNEMGREYVDETRACVQVKYDIIQDILNYVRNLV